MADNSAFQVEGTNAKALFTLKLHRGEGMLLIAMNWKNNQKPPMDFVGFAIEYKEPNGDKFWSVPNRIAFLDKSNKVNANTLSSRLSPIQKFRWIHFPMHADLLGLFTYKVTPVFMDAQEKFSYGESQQADIELRRETYPGQMNIGFTRGYISSQAFVDHYGKDVIPDILPGDATEGLTFKPKFKDEEGALSWMGFEARRNILELLDQAIADPTAKVSVVAYDYNLPELVSRMKKLKGRARIIIDDSKDHSKDGAAENQAEEILQAALGKPNVKRQHMGQLQHNKMTIVDGVVKAAIGGSTNMSWRGFFVQNNNTVVVRGKDAIQPFVDAFENYWNNENEVAKFGATGSAGLNDLKLPGIDVKVTFSPHSAGNAMLDKIATDVDKGTTSSLFFSMAFLYQTPGRIRDTFKRIAKDNKIFCCGISDKAVGGFDFLKPDGKTALVNPTALLKNPPEPFKSEDSGGKGIRMHHKFIVIDFDKPTARVYAGSYNFSATADKSNGENLFVIRDQRVAVAYMIEALRIFDHYQFRLSQGMKGAPRKLFLKKPPKTAAEKPWWDEDFRNARKIKDRMLFA